MYAFKSIEDCKAIFNSAGKLTLEDLAYIEMIVDVPRDEVSVSTIAGRKVYIWTPERYFVTQGFQCEVM